jgi:hypothetical protein
MRGACVEMPTAHTLSDRSVDQHGWCFWSTESTASVSRCGAEGYTNPALHKAGMLKSACVCVLQLKALAQECWCTDPEQRIRITAVRVSGCCTT